MSHVASTPILGTVQAVHRARLVVLLGSAIVILGGCDPGMVAARVVEEVDAVAGSPHRPAVPTARPPADADGRLTVAAEFPEAYCSSTSSPPPEPRSSTRSPGFRSATAVGFPHPRLAVTANSGT